MAQKGAIFVFCSSCKILNFANYILPRIIAEILTDKCKSKSILYVVGYATTGHPNGLDPLNHEKLALRVQSKAWQIHIIIVHAFLFAAQEPQARTSDEASDWGSYDCSQSWSRGLQSGQEVLQTHQGPEGEEALAKRWSSTQIQVKTCHHSGVRTNYSPRLYLKSNLEFKALHTTQHIVVKNFVLVAFSLKIIILVR